MQYNIPYARHSISQEDINAVTSVFKSDRLTQGKKTEEFEQALCDYTGAKYCIVCSSGTAALYMAIRAINLESAVIPAITYVATANAVRAQNISGCTNVIIGDGSVFYPKDGTFYTITVDYAGMPSYNYSHKVLIADAAHSLGATFKDRKVGTLAEITTTSFNAIKTITTGGEGGACFTDREHLYNKLKQLRNNGRDEKGLTTVPSLNFKMTEMQAALGISQLKRIDEFISKRKAIYDRYVSELPEIEFIKVPKHCTSSYHLVVMKHYRRDDIKKYLASKGIQTQINYIPLTDHPLYADQAANCPVAIEESRKILSLPCYVDMTEGEQEFVVKSVREAIR